MEFKLEATKVARDAHFIATGVVWPQMKRLLIPTEQLTPAIRQRLLDARDLLAQRGEGKFGTGTAQLGDTPAYQELPAPQEPLTVATLVQYADDRRRLTSEPLTRWRPWESSVIPQTPDEWATVVMAYCDTLARETRATEATRETSADAWHRALEPLATLPPDAWDPAIDDTLKSEPCVSPTVERLLGAVGGMVTGTPTEEPLRLVTTTISRTLTARVRERHEARREALRKARETAEAAKAAALAAEADAMAAWIAAHGSPGLKKAAAHGYEHRRLYAQERAALEYPGYAFVGPVTPDYADKANPSEIALDEALRVQGRVVWLKDGGPRATMDVEHPNAAPFYGPYAAWNDPAGQEAVVIENFVKKYTLIRWRAASGAWEPAAPAATTGDQPALATAGAQPE